MVAAIHEHLVFLLVSNLILLAIGCFMEALAALLILIPFLVPAAIGSDADATGRAAGSVRAIDIAVASALGEFRGGRLLSTEYTNNRAKLKWQCTDGHDFSMSWDDVHPGRWCPRCSDCKANILCTVILQRLLNVECLPEQTPDFLAAACHKHGLPQRLRRDGWSESARIGLEHQGTQHSRPVARLDLSGAIPSFIHISDGRMADVNVLDLLVPEPGAFYVMDRGYQDYARFYALDQAGSFFVTRAKRNLDARRLYSAPSDRRRGLICDQTIAFNGRRAAIDYPAYLRRIRYHDREGQKPLVFLTNHTLLPALTICALYKSRWQVELFFKWIKQHLRIRRFYGTSANAVRTQIRTAIAVYVLVAIVKKKLHLPASLHTMLQILSVTFFEKLPLQQTLAETPAVELMFSDGNQLNLFDS